MFFRVNQEEYNFQNMTNVSSINGTLAVHNSLTVIQHFYNIVNFIQPMDFRLMCILVYSILIILMIVSINIRAAFSVSVSMRASANLHNNMFNSILRGTLRFFDSSSSGNKDI